MLIPRVAAGILSVGLMVMGTGMVLGQEFPSKTIRVITTAAGGGSDFTARVVAQGLSANVRQPVVVDNRNGILASEGAAKAPPDGYTLLVAGASLWIYPLLQNAPYDMARDFSPITLIVRDVNLLAVHPSLPVKSVKELIALAKAKPGELNYSSVVAGGPAHLAVELFKSMAGVNIVNVPYKGSAPAIAALIGGEVQLTIGSVGLVIPHVKSGKARALAVTSATPSALVPAMPTVAASGLPGYEAVGMTGILAPSRTPETTVSRLNQEIVRVLNQAEVKDKFLTAGSEVVGNSSEEFAAIIKSDIVQIGKLIKDIGLKLN